MAKIQDNAIPNERELVANYIGKNSEKYLSIYDKYLSDGKPPIKFNAFAMLFGPIWFLYRKMYIEAVVIVLAPVVFYFVFPDMTSSGTTGIAGALGALANWYYVDRAIRKIRTLAKEESDAGKLAEELGLYGGVSKFSAAFGAVVVVGAITLSIMNLKTEAPACEDAGIQTVVK
ncbi:MAG: DUF2628 domain-containing protein, partial [Bdellovibrionales bacterium]|nr:DUF2628 domain-containing protein [Bdellovibrionales bacterium]